VYRKKGEAEISDLAISARLQGGKTETSVGGKERRKGESTEQPSYWIKRRSFSMFTPARQGKKKSYIVRQHAGRGGQQECSGKDSLFYLGAE